MKIETAFVDHVGGREEQQDAVQICVPPSGPERLLILADGMGGHAGGQLASRAVADVGAEVWSEHLENPMAPRALLETLIERAHARINEIGAKKGLSPRSTCVLLHIGADKAHWAHIGDSRLYRFRGGAYVGRTRDHSVVQMLLYMGKITEEEMGTHPDQNRLTQSLGGDGTPEPEFGEDDVAEGDAFILCSDGLWERITTDEMADALKDMRLEKKSGEMVAEAFKRGGAGSDNVSIAVARIGAPAPAAAKKRSKVPLAAFALVTLVAVGAAAVLTRPWEASGPSKAEIEAKKKAAEAEAKQKTEEAARIKAAEEARRKAEEEARREAAEEARRKAAAEEAKRKAAEEEAKRKAAEEAARKKAEEEEAKRKAEEDARRKAEEAAGKKSGNTKKKGPGTSDPNAPGGDKTEPATPKRDVPKPTNPE
jgi:serine/threonine protein phosphatase PrpC